MAIPSSITQHRVKDSDWKLGLNDLMVDVEVAAFK